MSLRIMLPETDEEAANLPPGLCLLGVAVVGRGASTPGVIPSSRSSGPALALLFSLADQTIRAAPLTSSLAAALGCRGSAG